MFTPDPAIRIGTNRYEGDLILNLLIAGQALVVAGVYNGGFHRTGLTSIFSALFSIALVAAEFATLQGISYLYQQRKIYYTTAIILSEIAYLLPKVVIVAALAFSQVIPLSTAIPTVGLLVLGTTRAGDNALFRQRVGDI